MLVIFKFEEEFYKKYGVEAQFIGHPLLDIVKPGMMKIDFLNTFKLSEHKTTIALLPGSRRQEVEKILPIMIDAAVLISKKIKNIQFVIAKSAQVDWQVYSRKITSPGIDLNIAEGRTYDCINNADFSIVASGTATLETALLEKPFVVVYKTSILNYLFYRPQVKVPYISIVNILAKRKIVPEFIQFQARAGKIAKTVVKLLQNSLELKRMKSDLAQIKTLLGEKGASLRAAKIIIDFLGV
jgi:lipid-A-disaccharide synthase